MSSRGCESLRALSLRPPSALAIALAAICLLGGAALRDEDVVARVNGTAIYRSSVRELVQGILAVQDTEPQAADVDKLAAEALDSLVALELLYQESQARGVAVSDAAVDEEVARTKQRFPSAQAFEEAMRAREMTADDLRRDTRKTMAVNLLLERAVWKHIRISPEQIKRFYKRNREEFKHPAQIRASHVLIRVDEKAPTAARQRARERAEMLLDKLKNGADFAELARDNSEDPGTAARGGDLGYFARGDMVDAFEKHAFALAPGKLGGVVSTPYGFHIIKVVDRRDAGYQPLGEVEERIRAVLTKTERQKREAEFVAELRKKAKIELLDKPSAQR